MSDLLYMAGLEDMDTTVAGNMEWFVMRDLKRPNAKLFAYQSLKEKGFEVFTPLKWIIDETPRGKVRRQIPAIHDLLFVHSRRSDLDPIVDKYPTLQYRFLKGCGYRTPMTVPVKDMERFVCAVNSSLSPLFFSPGEVTNDMLGKKVRIIGGPLDGIEGTLLKVRGRLVKRLLIELPGVLTTAVEVCTDYIEYIRD